jgi:hypothetical protein
MKRAIILISILISCLVKAQNKYDFDYCTEYLSTNKINDSINWIIFGNSHDENYTLNIHTKKNIVISAYFFNNKNQTNYRFNIPRIDVKSLNIIKHLKEYTINPYKRDIDYLKNLNCHNYDHFDKEFIKNDSIEKTSYSFYYNKRKKILHSKVIIETIESEVTSKQLLEFGHGSFCFKCLDTNFQPRIIKSFCFYIKNKIHEKYELINTDTAKFSLFLN